MNIGIVWSEPIKSNLFYTIKESSLTNFAKSNLSNRYKQSPSNMTKSNLYYNYYLNNESDFSNDADIIRVHVRPYQKFIQLRVCIE